MSVGPLVTEISITFLVVACMLHKYGNWSRHHVLVTINVFIAWYFAFIIIFILPLDVSSTAYRQCLKNVALYTTVAPDSPLPYSNESDLENVTILVKNNNATFDFDNDLEESSANICQVPWSNVPEGVLPSLWRVVYWTAQCLTWIILPLMQSYSTAGDFTVTGKLKTALVENAIYYGTYLLIFGVLLIYVAVQPGINLDAPKLKVICITASNTWGLFLLVLLQGYGLVEIPRSCWNNTKKGYMLNYLYFKAAKLSTERCEAEEKVDDFLEEIQQVSDCIPVGHPLRKHVDLILEKCPEDKKDIIRHRRRHSDSSQISGAAVGERNLARLHKQIIRAIHMYHRTQCQWSMLLEQVFYWEDVVRNESSRDKMFKPTFIPERSAVVRALFTPRLEWYWNCIVRNWVYRTLSVVLVIFSSIVVWSEMTFFTQSPTLSLFAIFINSAKTNYNYIVIEIISIATIAYLCVCAYYTVFRVRVLNYYYLAPHHQTNEYSLIFCGMLLCRLTPPLCLNFLGLIHLDSHVTKNSNIEETSYTRIMGHMDVISIVSDGFNIYFPILIFFVCLATYFNLGSRVLHMLGFEQFVGDDDMTSDLVEEGRELIKREKNKRQRLEDGENRRRQFHSRFGGSAPYRSGRKAVMKDTSLVRSPSDENARAELLRDVEPIDYTEERGPRSAMDAGDAEMNPVARDDNDFVITEGSSYHRSTWNRIGRPPAGIFDDV